MTATAVVKPVVQPVYQPVRQSTQQRLPGDVTQFTRRALGSLPSIDHAFREGKLSYSKVRALTRVATAENEDALLAAALQTNAEGVEHIVRRVKQSECLGDVQAMIRSRSLSTRWDDSGALIVQGRLTPEQGEVFLKALAKATESLVASDRCVENSEGEVVHDAANDDSYWAQRSDALIQVMADSLGGREAPPQNNSAETQQTKHKNVPAGTLLHPETIRRLACDGGLVTILEHPNGDPLNVGRKTRAIPPSTRRALVSRDRHCQFPGCSQDRYVEGHHIVHWAQGGETKLSNLVLLCSRHHLAVHELGYRIRCSNGSNGNGNGTGTMIEFVKLGAG